MQFRYIAIIFTCLYNNAICASVVANGKRQVGGLNFGGMLGGGDGLSRPNRGSRDGFDQEATTGLLNGGIGAANGLVKLGTAEETITEERVVEVPAPQERQQDELDSESETESDRELELADTRASQLRSHMSPEDELFIAHYHLSPEEKAFFLEEKALFIHEVPEENFHKEIDIEEKPSNPVIVKSKPEGFSFYYFMPEFAKSFFQDESA